MRSAATAALPYDIVWRTERKLNDPDCKDSSSPDRCAATAGPRYQQSRLGWAAQTLNDTCYDLNGKPRRYSDLRSPLFLGQRQGRLRSARRPHGRDPDLARAARWRHRRLLLGLDAAPGRRQGRAKKLPCKDKLTIARVPFSLDKAQSGVSVAVRLPDGRDLRERDVVVEDLFVVALGDSFSLRRKQSRPAGAVQRRAARWSTIPKLLRDQVASGPEAPESAAEPGSFGLASNDDQVNPKVLPRRLMEDELAERYNSRISDSFPRRLRQGGAAMAHPRLPPLAIRLSVPRRHPARAREPPSLDHLRELLLLGRRDRAYGLFLEMDAREGYSDPASPRCAAARPARRSDLPRRAAARTQQASYTLPMFTAGNTSVTPQRITKTWCPPAQRKRQIDIVLMSIGGNDVGFGGLVAYSMTESAADFAPIAAWIGRSIRFGPQVSRVYLDVLDERMKALKDALNTASA